MQTSFIEPANIVCRLYTGLELKHVKASSVTAAIDILAASSMLALRAQELCESRVVVLGSRP